MEQIWQDILVVLWRMISVFLVFLVIALLIGKRHVAELSIFDFIIAITLGAVAGADLADPEVPHWPTIFAIVGLGIINVGISRFVLKSRKFGRWVTFDPTLVISQGKIIDQNLKKVRFTIDELLSQLREKDVFDLGEIEYAVLEPHGIVSVLKKKEFKPLTPKDMQMTMGTTSLPLPLIIEGKVQEANLSKADWDKDILLEQIMMRGVNRFDQVFLAILDTEGKMYVSPYQGNEQIIDMTI